MANYCEDYPCCGHEAGDCDGSLYGSDESIKAYALAHAYCDHEAGVYDCDESYFDDDDEDELTAEELEERGTADAEAAYDAWLWAYQEHNPYGPDEDGLRESDFI